MNLPVLAVAWTLVLLSASVSRAVELDAGASLSAGYNSRVIGRGDSEVDDLFVRVGPRIQLSDHDGILRWDLRYQPAYQAYRELSGLDDWDHEVRGRFGWDMSPRTNLEMQARYFDVASSSTLNDEIILPDGSVDTALTFADERIKRTVLTGTFNHSPTSVDSLSIGANWFDFDPEGERRVAQTTGGLNLSWVRRVGRQDSLGIVLRYSRQTVALEREDAQTNFYNASLRWSHTFSPTLSLSVTAGPAWVDAEQQDVETVLPDRPLFPIQRGPGGIVGNVQASTCPTLDEVPGAFVLDEICETFGGVIPGTLGQTTDLRLTNALLDDTDPELTYFAAIVLRKSFRRVDVSLQYLRDTDNSASQTSVRGTIRDTVTGTLSWHVTRRLHATFRASWSRTEIATDAIQLVQAVDSTTVAGFDDVARAIGIAAIEGGEDRETIRYVASMRVGYDLSAQTEIFLRVFYSRQDREFGNARTSDDRLRVVLGITFMFASIPLGI